MSEFDVPLNTSSPLVPVRVTANATRGVAAVSRSNIATAVSATVVIVIGFFIFGVLFVIFCCKFGFSSHNIANTIYFLKYYADRLYSA